MGTIESMLQNHEADSWDDTARFGERSDTEQSLLDKADDPTLPKLERLDAYVDYCFKRYPIVGDVLDREQIQTAMADWGQRRGQCKWNKRHDGRREFGKRINNSHFTRDYGNHVVMVATALIGVPPEDDKGCGWKPCVRHELGHAIQAEKYGTDVDHHGSEFKSVMSQFNEEMNDGGYAQGHAPMLHR